MPSKNNKKLAAAERAAKLRAEAEANPVVEEEVETPAVSADNLPPAAPPTSEVAALAVTIEKPSIVPSTSEQKKKKVSAPYKPPSPLTPLTSTGSKTVITNSYRMEIKKHTNRRYDVTVSKNVDGRVTEIVGARGADKQQQNSLFQLITGLLKDDRMDLKNISYDGALSLYNSSNQELAGRAFFLNSGDLPQNLRSTLFPRNEHGTLNILIERNTQQPTLDTQDVLQENLNGASCPVTQMLQQVMHQEAKRNGFVVVDNGTEMFEKPQGAADNGVHKMNGIGAGLKIAKGGDGKGAVHIVMEYKTTRFFDNGPLSALEKRVKFNDIYQAQRYLSGLKVGTTYSNQVITIHGLSSTPISKLTYDGHSVLARSAEVAHRPVEQYNKNWPAIQTRIRDRRTREYKVFSFPIENLRVLPDQKLMPKHGSPPTCPVPGVRFAQTTAVGQAAKLLSPNPTLASFGAQILPTPITVQAVEVPAPTILYKDSKDRVVQAMVNRESAKWIKPAGAKFFEPASPFKVLILYNSVHLNSEEQRGSIRGKVENVKEQLQSMAARGTGLVITVSGTEDLGARFGEGVSAGEAIRMKLETLKNLPANEKPVVIYIDHSTSQTHGVLKLQERLCEVVTQQMSIDKSLKKPIGGATLTNFLLKFNQKRGGMSHKVQPDAMIAHLYGDQSNTLIISYDVCHSSGKVYVKGEFCEEPSCVGFAYNSTKSREMFIGDFAYQSSRHERVDEQILKEKTKDILNKYGISHHKAPSSIIILRDGVSEGQHQMVYDDEFPSIEQAVTEFVQEKNKFFKEQKKNIVVTQPAIALLVITKRHANRLYQRDEQGVIKNVSPLLAVDTVVVKKAGNEMLFVSHCPLKGTAQFIAVHTIINQKVFTKNDEIVRLLAALSCARQVSTSVVSLPESIYAADDYAKRGADLFREWKLLMVETGGEVPMVHTENGMQFDWRAITERLNYQNSCFKNIRIA
ncbi:hypothetical protein CAEBREN_07338 [Caenorhabditis brenneri]|uniref:Piwi domain-containing protein n=1 Tax=Caenorhabditis brenneri TaxID=135651 RepID=G0P8N0_CAEBE|nr:hypothetical protein CAEBREN_07338 [Caenorhabditis brenneri]